MKRWIGPVAVALAVVTAPALLNANTPRNFYVQMFGEPLETVLHEARQFAFYSVERCHRDVIEKTNAKQKVPKDSCSELNKAADAFETARLGILRRQLEAQRK